MNDGTEQQSGQQDLEGSVIQQPQFALFLAGLSGAGASSALHHFADLGFSVLENLPLPLLGSFLEYAGANPQKYQRLCIHVELDSESSIQQFLSTLISLESSAFRPFLLYLDASSEIILRRYSETRRPHPKFAPELDSSLHDTIHRERELYDSVRFRANWVIDTSSLTIHQLRRSLTQMVQNVIGSPTPRIRLNFVSFGFKNGIPRDCDLLMDVRFLPNPYFVDHLKHKVGLEKDVATYVLESDAATSFLVEYERLLRLLLPQYTFEGKAYLNVGIGCTGGKHRSVAIAEELRRRVEGIEGVVVSASHRDVNK
jgi:UPF0042 nucleotide-binding protein